MIIRLANGRALLFGLLFAAFVCNLGPNGLYAQTAIDPTKKPKRIVGLGLQSWNTQSSFPEDWVEEHWAKDYHITHVSYGDGVCAVVMSKDSGLGLQYWKTSSTFPHAIRAPGRRMHWPGTEYINIFNLFDVLLPPVRAVLPRFLTSRPIRHTSDLI